VVAKYNKVCSFNNGAHLILVVLIDEDVVGSGNPLEKVGEDGGGNDADICLRITTTQPRGKSRRGTYGIAIGAAMAGEDNIVSGREELVPE
jgi:hypothetical protein